MYATHLAPSVPLGIGGPMAKAEVRRIPSILFGLMLYLSSCLIAGFVIGMCLVSTFKPVQTSERVGITINIEQLDTSQITELHVKCRAPEQTHCIYVPHPTR